MLKLTGGEHRGRALKWLDTPTIRPTPARVREAVFNILADQIPGSRWWDLCCGSGVVGIEALSRDAEQVMFVDQNRRSLELLKENLAKLGLKPRTKVFCQDVRRWLNGQEQIDADLIYCDPPYDSPVYQPILDRLSELPLGRPSLLLILEYRKGKARWQPPPVWSPRDERSYGDTCLALLERTREALPEQAQEQPA